MKRQYRASSNRRHRGTGDAHVTDVIDAVCRELGIDDRDGRAVVTSRVEEAYARGARQPLNLVNAGLTAL